MDNKTILELGCGAAGMTKKLASSGSNRKIIATEVDKIQHEKNLQLNIENVEFVYAGAQNIPLDDDSVHMICMFKSFHHIPKELMNDALLEIKRVLKPNGLAYISEPLFQGDQNYLVSLFHDEKQVRKDAFDAIKNFVDNDEMKLFREIFFQTPVSYHSFKDFEIKQMNLSYNSDTNNTEIIQKVEKEYNRFANEKGENHFLKPFRVDILQNI